MMRRMLSGEPADSHCIQRTNSSETCNSPRSDCTCSRTSASSRVPTWMIGKVHSFARVSHDASGSWTTPSAPSLVTVPITSRLLCLDSVTRNVKSSAVERARSEEHTSELQSHLNLVCRLLLEKKKQTIKTRQADI